MDDVEHDSKCKACGDGVRYDGDRCWMDGTTSAAHHDAKWVEMDMLVEEYSSQYKCYKYSMGNIPKPPKTLHPTLGCPLNISGCHNNADNDNCNLQVSVMLKHMDTLTNADSDYACAHLPEGMIAATNLGFKEALISVVIHWFFSAIFMCCIRVPSSCPLSSFPHLFYFWTGLATIP